MSQQSHPQGQPTPGPAPQRPPAAPSHQPSADYRPSTGYGVQTADGDVATALQRLTLRDQLRSPAGATAIMCLGLVTSVLLLYFTYQFEAAMRREDMFVALNEGRVTGGFGLLWFPQYIPVFAAWAGFVAFPLRRSAAAVGGAVLTLLAIVAAVGTIMIGNHELQTPSMLIAGVGLVHLLAFVGGAFLFRRHQA